MATWNHKYMYYGHKESQLSIFPGLEDSSMYVLCSQGLAGEFLSVVVFQNKLSNVISGSFITHLTKQTTSYFVIHHFKKMALCRFSAMGKLGPLWNENFLQKFLHLIWHSLIVIERISKWGGTLLFSEVNFWKTVLSSAQLDQVRICKLDIGLQHRSGRGEPQYHRYHQHQHHLYCHHQHRHHHQHHLHCHHQHRSCKLDIGHGCTPSYFRMRRS